ncbi:MAG TPA: hypothetical protein DD622_00375 [Opitutae bacterium]|nr:hypothetical protein [Opitutae bacterium]
MPPLHPKSVNQKNGFALVIALSLMAFILLLVLSLSILVQVESSSASINRDRLQARLNAELGAMIALGDLQRYTGPDQRVTARADVLLNPVTGERGPPGQERWIGVWSSNASPSDPLDVADGLSSRQPRWLVSGQDPDATSALAPIDSLRLASVGNSVIDKSTINQDDSVVAAKVKIRGANDVIAGHYAYWVSDEGIKARFDLADRHQDSIDPDVEYYRTAMAQQADPTAVSNIVGKQLLAAKDSRWKNTSLDPSKISSVKNIQVFLQGALTREELEEWNREFFHDFTVHSSGVLANTKDGGLKRDLSTGLLRPLSDMTGPIFPAAGSVPSEGDPGGPTWEQLADYFNLTKNPASNLEFRMPGKDQVGIAPVVTRFNFIVQVFAAPITTTTSPALVTDFQYYVGVFPLISLWNPYDVDLEMPDLGVQTDMVGILVRDAPVDGESLGEILPHLSVPRVEEQRKRFLSFAIDSTTIPAGEVVNFTPPINSFIALDNPEQNVLKPGASAEQVRGFFYGPSFLSPPVLDPNDPSPSTGVLMSDSICFGESLDNQLWRQVINLYSNTTFDHRDRFLTLLVNGMGKIYKNNDYYSPRVIRLDQGGLTTSEFLTSILPQNSSAVAPQSDMSIFDLVEMRTESQAHTISGFAAIMNLPESSIERRDRPVNLLTQFNPRAPKSFPQIHMSIANDQASSVYDTVMGFRQYGLGEVSWWEGDNSLNFTIGADDVSGHIGMSNTSISGSDQMVLFESPKKQPINIGQLMHANLMNTYEVSHTFYRGDSDSPGWHINFQQVHTTPAYAVGNSLANIHLPLGQTRMQIDDPLMFDGPVSINSLYKGAHYDYSYELNDALWDNYFFSGIDTSADNPLPNSLMVPADYSIKKEDFDYAELEGDARLSAANLVLKGAFNVNSTSVAAWESVLGAMRDIATLGVGPSEEEYQLHNFSRFISPIIKSTISATRDVPLAGISDPLESPSYASSKDEIVAGYRALTDPEIALLSTAIVREIRARCSSRGHPFLSLADFINRSIDQDDINDPVRKRFSYVGALQHAIDQSGVNGTPALSSDWEKQKGYGLWEDNYLFYQPNLTTNPYWQDSVDSLNNRPVLEGAPGFLTQADVMAKIGGSLASRSDTFTIRSYGESSNGLTSSDQAKACLETVVQRTSEYMSTNDSYLSSSLPIDQQFGRSFKIVSTRWLNVAEL